MISKKEKWIDETFQKIRNKNLIEPFKLDSGTTVTNLELYLSLTKSAMMHTEKTKLLKHFISELERLLEL